MQRKGRLSVMISIVLVFTLILPALDLTAGNSEQDTSPSPQHESNYNEESGFPAGWSGDIRLSYNVDDPLELTANWSLNPSIAVNGSNIHVVWAEGMGSVSTEITQNSEVYYRKSTDSGATWGEPIQLTYDFFEDPTEFTAYGGSFWPEIAVNGSNIHVVYETLMPGAGKFEIFYINSTNNGETWNEKQMLTANDTRYSTWPDIAVNGSDIHIVWGDERDFNYEIYYINSTNGGISWSEEQRLTTYLGYDGMPLVGVKNSNIHIGWSRYLSNNEIFYMNSDDGGISWGLEQQLTPNDGITTDFYDMALDGSNLHIVYTDHIDLVAEVYYFNSTDGGNSWSPPQRLSDLTEVSSQAAIAVNGNNVSVIWMDKKDHYPYYDATELYYVNSSNNGISWSENRRLTFAYNYSFGPAIVFGDDILHVVWTDNRTGREPLIIADNYEIYYKRYPDFPDTTPPNHFNETPTPDSYKDAPGTNVSVHVTDPSGVNESTIQLWVNGSLVVHTLTPITDGFNVSYVSPGFSPGVIECRIVADDNLSNTLDYTWNFTVLALYDIQLQEGWNLISVPHVQVDTAINEVLRDIEGKWNYIQYYDATNGQWKSYATFWPESLNDLFEINRTMAIWINITEPNVNLTVRGHIPSSTSINLYAGWNLVSYPTMSTETVANALWGTGADKVEAFDPAEPYRIREVGPSYVMKPGEGYWVHVPVDTTWTIDW